MQAAPEFIDLIPVSEESPRNGEGSILELTDGRLLFVYTHFYGYADNSSAAIAARYSSDRGATWTEPEIVIADEAEENVMSVSLLRLQSGGVLMVYLRKDGNSNCTVWARRSYDEGKTWGEAVGATPEPGYHECVNDCVIQLSNGRIIIPSDGCEEVWTADERIRGRCLYSDNDGATWRGSNYVTAPTRGTMELRVVELRDGRLWLLARTDQGVLYESFSEDNGETWDEARPSGIESPQTPFVFTRIPATGDLLLIRNPIVDMSHPMQGVRTPLAASISRDEGETWENAKDLEVDTSQTYCYLSACFLDDLTVLSYYVGTPTRPLQNLRIARVPTVWFYE